MAVIIQCKVEPRQQNDGSLLLQKATGRESGFIGQALHFKPRKMRLTEASDFLQFTWAAHAIDGWIADSRRRLLLEDAPRNPLAAIVLLQKHQDFEARLAAYYADVIRKFIELKNALAKRGDRHTVQIAELHDTVIGHWQSLVEASQAKTLKLAGFAASCNDTVELLREFTAKAREFDVWCTNAMKTLSCAIPCNDPTKLAHQQKLFLRFLGSLHTFEERLGSLQALGSKLQELELAIGPYTRRTLEGLRKTWTELMNIADEYSDELEEESLRQKKASGCLLWRLMNSISEFCPWQNNN